jgi:hypothetical protein
VRAFNLSDDADLDMEHTVVRKVRRTGERKAQANAEIRERFGIDADRDARRARRIAARKRWEADQ